jgi:hypothetical protein
MSLLRATFHFSVRTLWIRRELLGTTHDLEHRRRIISLTLPLRDPASPFGEGPAWPEEGIGRPLPVGRPSAGTTDDPEQIVSVHVVRTSVEFDADVSAADFVADKSAAASDAFPAFMEAAGVSRGALTMFLDWVRVRSAQPWLGLSGETPELIDRMDLVDVEAGVRLPVGFSESRRIELLPQESALTAEAVDAILSSVRKDAPPPIAASLLADAQYLAWHAETRDLTRAVLLAAIGAEVKVKQTLQELVPAPSRPLLDVILDNPRDVSLPVRALFDKALVAAIGRSLREEDPPLYRRVDSLFQIRNAIAHRGQTPNEDKAHDAVRAAREAFVWLDNLPK